MSEFVKRIRIQNEPVLIIGSLFLDFLGAGMGVAWMYKESILYEHFKPLSKLLIIVYIISFFNLADLAFGATRNSAQSRTTRVVYRLFFLFQCFMTIGIFVNLFLISLGLWE
jgi:hypothetical protein